ncbi:MAG: DNA translocase FtsK [Devosiaceae bacterium]|nr:DNA translocase FtsK [Devosiaceae bacterium]
MARNSIVANKRTDGPQVEPQTFVAIKIPLRLIGFLILGAIVLAFVSYATWSVDDPSFSYATDKQPSNWLSFPGAVFSDIWMQFFGLAGIVMLVPPSIWAWGLLFRRTPDAWPLRIVSLFGAGILLAGIFSFLPTTQSWPLPTGLGGFLGGAFTSLATMVTGNIPTGTGAIIYIVILAPPTFALFWISAGIRSMRNRQLDSEGELQDVDDEKDRTGFFDIAFGALVHFSYSAKTAWRRARKNMERDRADQADEEWKQSANEPQLHQASVSENSDINSDGFERHEPPIMDELAFQNSRGDTGEYGQDLYPDDPHAQDFDQASNENISAYNDHSARLSVEQAARLNAGNQASAPNFVSPANGPNQNPQAQTPLTVAQAAQVRPGSRLMKEAQGSLLEESGFKLPELSLLSPPKANPVSDEHHPDELEVKARQLKGVLEDFGIKGDIINVRPGPVVTLYELEPAPGIKSSRIISLADDIARSMSAVSARVAVVPGRNVIGIELPNRLRETVYLREMLASSDFEKVKGKLPICLGKTIGGEPIIADLARMPHLLIAGTTGSGKSVAVNTMILSLLYRMTPEQCRLIMIDPKMLELSIYDGIPHLLSPVVTDPTKAVVALKWAVREMEDRYRKMSKIGVRNIEGFNTRVSAANKKGETITRTVQTGFDRETGEAIYESESFELEPLPYIVVVVDEMADLMMVAGKDIEGAIQRLAQMARAAGIHLIMATQRPSVDVITGTIKANFPTRISFQVTSKIDSRTILGEQGAEQLLGMGDMLYMAGGGRVRRLHGPFVADGEVEDVVAHLKDQGAPDYLETVTQETEEETADGGMGNSGDELYDKAVNIVLNDRKASTSYIQRRLSIGYNRAATLIERMENEGVISAANHAGKREVLVGEGVDY